jgi:hypothetical protein
MLALEWRARGGRERRNWRGGNWTKRQGEDKGRSRWAVLVIPYKVDGHFHLLAIQNLQLVTTWSIVGLRVSEPLWKSNCKSWTFVSITAYKSRIWQSLVQAEGLSRPDGNTKDNQMCKHKLQERQTTSVTVPHQRFVITMFYRFSITGSNFTSRPSQTIILFAAHFHLIGNRKFKLLF